ncbi:metallopeptidase family protein [Qipengyuania zhejiangensis]|uniref:metallopeptidase family protein n=1 Tax=Qipengyuania zhejiangensis TaxID=3077782 RepID=UPI002D79FBCD|nr:metallopeptidase family protein [Qipengyuania sp. Z2]
MRNHQDGPTRVQMQVMAQAVVASLPVHFRDQLGDVILKVEDFATLEQLQAVGLDDRWDLTGLYEGQALPDRSIWESGTMPPCIWLFREPLIAEWRSTGVQMDDLVRHVVVHEAGHHFGFSDEDMHWLEDEAD